MSMYRETSKEPFSSEPGDGLGSKYSRQHYTQVCQAQQVVELKHHLHGQTLHVAVREIYHMKQSRRGEIEAVATN